MSVRFPAALRSTHRVVSPEDIVGTLVDDIDALYEHLTLPPRRLREVSLRELWHIARELTLSVDRWARKVGEITGMEKMRIAEEAAWELLRWWGGARALRDALVGQIGGRPFGVFTGSILSRLLSERVLRKLVIFVLELAVSEIRGAPATSAP